MIKIGRKYRGLRPYYIEDRQVIEINIYNSVTKEVVLKINRGWFEQSSGDIEEITVNELIKRLKPKFDGKSFWIPIKSNYEKVCALYIGDEATLIDFGEKIDFTTVESVHYHTPVTIELNDRKFTVNTKFRSELTDFGAYVERVKADFVKKGIDISTYDLRKMLELYDLKEKEQ